VLHRCWLSALSSACPSSACQVTPLIAAAAAAAAAAAPGVDADEGSGGGAKERPVPGELLEVMVEKLLAAGDPGSSSSSSGGGRTSIASTG
jgi:hypothetical protein